VCKDVIQSLGGEGAAVREYWGIGRMRALHKVVIVD
jgi:hypothetical protein